MVRPLSCVELKEVQKVEATKIILRSQLRLLLGGIAVAQAIPPIAIYFSVVCSPRSVVCLSSVTLLHSALTV